ncbi:MAG: hypothetical protein JJ926_01540 [Roseitalea sp.]|jgi:hypothetical protein|uniref:DUF333 domain-containing protein n=2 Tax=Oceaniradius stylonematis TaxID=2184161 RepID=A0A3A8ANP8_9HYPH|nr:hypothetical protein [Oceaniradius stylonematis]MBO6552538.1 hypothetical protein [Roseitalea sp.]MBO6950542.1 hypothetical protein [Rhizobiaceae bacterium]RNC94949.1 MAG: hypothetical protein ED558_09235 [Oricola sp.]MBO6591471.1 hypothetical protein [Roseitalea sp.]MBO6599326.1 hypothetical protein [Roseitalea sp.]
MMKRCLAVILAVGAVSLPAPALAQKVVGPDIPCTCRFKGQDVPVGQTMCLDLPSGEVLATCDRVLNNTAWKTVQQGCPVPGLS